MIEPIGAPPLTETATQSAGLKIIRPGLLSTVQDLGRAGLQHLGIVPGGVMDAVAHRLANALVGNEPHAATLEITVLGPELVFGQTLLIALSGAQFHATIDQVELPPDRPVLVSAGARLKIKQAAWGGRAYLAVAGGIDVPMVLGSRSTYLPAGYGGLAGRLLRAGDALPLTSDSEALSRQRFAKLTAKRDAARLIQAEHFTSLRWSVPPMTLPNRDPIVVRAMPGMHFEWFSPQSQRDLFDTSWRVSPQSNRIGFRLLGTELTRQKTGDILSGPTCLGTVQVPASGLPIVLMADHQTSGGYAKIVEIASADIARLAQLAPGARVRFIRCTLDEALQLKRRASDNLAAKIRSIQSEYQS